MKLYCSKYSFLQLSDMHKRSKTFVNFQAPLDQNLDETSKQNGFRDHTGCSCNITHPPGKYSLDLQVNKERVNKPYKTALKYRF